MMAVQSTDQPGVCKMFVQDPMDFAWCETHDETFPLGAICRVERGRLAGAAVTARARGDWAAERRALDALALDERARAGLGVEPQ